MGLYIIIHIFCKLIKECPSLHFVVSFWFNTKLYIYVCLCFIVSFCFSTQFLYIYIYMFFCNLFSSCYNRIPQIVWDCVCLNFIFSCFSGEKFIFACLKISNSKNLCMLNICSLLLLYKFLSNLCIEICVGCMH
jgi:hypothetical protein